jgi:hypothetical protein
MKIRFHAVAAVVSVLVSANVAVAQDYPSRSVRIILPFPPGGGTDVFARVAGGGASPRRWARRRSWTTGPARAGNIGAELTAKSPADGHTLMVTTSAVRGERDALPEGELRPAQGPRRDHAARLDLQRAVGASFGAGAHAAELVALSKRTRAA